MRKIHGDAKIICKSVIVSILLSVIITAIVTLIVTIGVCGCDKRDGYSVSSDDDPRFRKIYDGSEFDVYIDSETNVEYWFWSGAHYAEMVPLLDKDGKPLIYKGE